MRILTWNIYRGTINNYTINNLPASQPVQRMQIIMDIAIQNNVDVVVLQELPNDGGHFYAPQGWGIQTIAEHASMQYACSSFNTLYAILWNTATTTTTNVQGTIQRFNQQSFFLPTGCEMRAPVYLDLTCNGTAYRVFNWHNETGAWADTGVQILSQQAFGANTVIGGDFNRNYTVVNTYFNNTWTDIVGVNGAINGVDHILSNVANCNPVMGGLLDFTSDANHWPVAADIL